MTPLILASESPRRRQLLAEAGFKFSVVPVKVSEIPDKNLNIHDQILDIAGRKVRAAFADLKSRHPGPFLVLSADTEVIFNHAPLGKPIDAQDAHRILRLLSGRAHQVLTAVAIIDSRTGREYSQVETTQILFKKLTDAEISAYIQTGDPMDKAGAYGIQSGGAHFVEKIEGPFDNVVGLPMEVVRVLLQKIEASS
jgi:septum formation protein